MSSKNPYSYFNQYVLRTPLLPFNIYEHLTEQWNINEELLKNTLQDIQIRESIFLASPDLITAVNKWLENKLDITKTTHLHYSVLKYITRMTTRCTPFGLFAGVSLGNLGEKTNIRLKSREQHTRRTRLDMNYLLALTQHLTKNQAIRNRLKFYSNTSIYKIGDHYRYVEYEYVNSKRKHHLVGVKSSWHLDKVLMASKKGGTIEQLANEINEDNNLELESCLLFINELIDNQILISELEPSLCGIDILEYIINTLRNLNIENDILETLINVLNYLNEIDKSFINCISSYDKIIKQLEKIDVPFDIKYLFQTDLKTTFESNTLSKELAYKINNILVLFNKMTLTQPKSFESEFKKAFYKRYETRPVKLTNALDHELGINFNKKIDFGEVNCLIDDLELPKKKNKISITQTQENAIQEILQQKLIECLTTNQEILTLKDEDFIDFHANWDDLPDTMSSLVEIIKIDGKEKIICDLVGGSSGANLLARFCHIDENITQHVKSIVKFEETLYADKIIAEIVHLPDSHISNVLIRPHLRSYEIPYLATSRLNEQQKISINDLEIVAKNPKEIAIYSKKHRKEVIPRLTTAHSYLNGALPIYQFLSSSQNHNKRSGIGFRWGELGLKFSFLPRVEYQDVILSPKLWNIKKKDIEGMLKNTSDDKAFKVAACNFIELKNIPKYALLIEGDNELLINFENKLSIKMMVNIVKSKTMFQLKEFLHDSENVVTSTSNNFSNQVLLTFYNRQKLTPNN